MGLTVNRIPIDGSAPVPRGLMRTVGFIALLFAAGTAAAAWPAIVMLGTTRPAEGRFVAVKRAAAPGDPVEGERRGDSVLVIAFRTADGREFRITEQRRLLQPPEFWLGQTVPVRYRPEAPETASTDAADGLLDVALIVGFFAVVWGAVWAVLLRASVLHRRRGRRHAKGRQGPRDKDAPRRPQRSARPAGAGHEVMARLVGLRQLETAEGTRWIVQARATDPRSGAERLIESEPLPFDPVPQMRQMNRVAIAFDPSRPDDGPYRMDLSFLRDPGPDGGAPGGGGALRRG